MQNRKTIGYVLLVGGVVVLAVSLLADVIGVGGSGVMGFKQIIGAVVGAVAAAAGLILAVRK